MKDRISGLCVTIIGILGGTSSWVALDDPLRIILLIISILVFLIGLIYIFSLRWHVVPYIQRPNYSLEKEIEKSSTVWFAWHTGSVKLAEGSLFEDNHKYKFLLTKPNSPTMDVIGKVANIGADELNSDVIKFTDIIREKKHYIRWYDGFLGSSLIISDPEEKTGWVRVEAFLPILGAKFRPSIKFYRKYNEKEFLMYKQLYETLWKNSISPN